MNPPARPPLVIRHAAVDSGKLQLARTFRRRPTAAEATAWQILRSRALFGLKFRRQQILAGFIVDFYCAERRLALELDGGVHDDPAQRAYDDARHEALARLSIRVLRIRNHDVHEQVLRDLLEPYAGPERRR
jgi:very-short-patch-repair endonuclease